MKNTATGFFAAFALALALPVSMAISIPAAAATDNAVSPQYQTRSDDLLELLKGNKAEDSFFAKSFLDAVPVAQFQAGMAQIKAQYGEPLSIQKIIPASETDGTVEILFEKATVALRMVIDRDAPHPVIGLQVTGANINKDSIDKIKSEMEALSGSAGFQIAELGSYRLKVVDSLNADKQFAIGSTFKLHILSLLSRQIRAGEKKWSDVVPLNRKSLPSGVIQNWPEGAPLTLQTLATLMISISDNSATDMLIENVRRREIEKYLRNSGHGNPDKAIPFLTTLEAFALKMPKNDDLRERFEKASEKEQQALLVSEKSRLGLDSVSIANLATTPRHIDTIEWFASPAELNSVLNDMRSLNDRVVQDILAINPIIPPGDAKRWAYLGAKGGSEPGVVSFAFLVRAKSGKSYGVSGSWNNNAAPVENDKFLLLMNRLLNLTAGQ